MDGNTIKCPSCGNDIPKGTKECYICGERLEKPVHVPKYAAGDEFDRVERIKRPKKMNDKTTFLIIIGVAVAFCLIGLIVLAKIGFFVNRNGVYVSDDLKEYYKNRIESQGERFSEDNLDYTCSITVDGDSFEWLIDVKYNGVSLAYSMRRGTITFSSEYARMKFNDYGYIETKANFYPGKSIKMFMDSDSVKEFGTDIMSFYYSGEQK